MHSTATTSPPVRHNEAAVSDRSSWRSWLILLGGLLPGGLLLASVLVSGCRTEQQTCLSAENCPADAVCIDGLCQKRACFTSTDCAIEYFCDQAIGQCATGCLLDSDCPYGSGCNMGQCAQKACLSTELDCDVGEYCDTTTGTCFASAAPHCAPCVDSSDCGGGSNLCRYVGGTGPYCLLSCDVQHPCPAGYSCSGFTVYGDVVAYYCYSVCGYINSADTYPDQNRSVTGSELWRSFEAGIAPPSR